MDFSILDLHSDDDNIDARMKLLEDRYALENQFIEDVSRGFTQKAESVLTNNILINMESRTPDSIRNFKNYCIILNTLLRKAVEKGTVHPIHIDRLSAIFARKIEVISSISSGKILMREMVRKYCLLVKNHSMKGYSLLIQKIITRVDTDLTENLTLSTLAKHLNVNASYLSTLFRKETGQTLTEYVNTKRIQHALFLLNSTNMQIQTVAQHCGIPDINYFTKIFKKHVGMTPSDYRKNLHTT